MNRKDWEKQVFSSNMNTTARLVAIAIGSHGNWTEAKSVWPSLKAIADMAGISRDTAKDYVEALENQGWLRHVATRKNNVKEYELLPQVADTIGILSKRKRTMSKTQLQNLSATNTMEVADTIDNLDNQVAETKELGCRNEESRLPKREGQVADSICTNLKENLLDRNLKENLEGEEPIAGAPVSSNQEDSFVRKEEVPLSRSETVVFDELCLVYNIDDADASLTKNMLKRKKNVSPSPNFRGQVLEVFEEIGIRVGEAW